VDIDALTERRGWIFDLDGTLTEAVHDFAALRRSLGMPDGVGLLEYLATQPRARADALEAHIAAWEAAHAEVARAESDAVALLERLVARGVRIGVLTRNLRALAVRTLEVAGIAHIPAAAVVGRDTAPPKPAPDGILRLLDQWALVPSDAVMVGDWGFDVEAGRAAGVASVLVDRSGAASRFADRADVVLPTLHMLAERFDRRSI
jgi:HAD superfamily hydrolase (TIGR01509 family)